MKSKKEILFLLVLVTFAIFLITQITSIIIERQAESCFSLDTDKKYKYTKLISNDICLFTNDENKIETFIEIDEKTKKIKWSERR